MLALALQHREIDDEEIAVDLLALAGLEHDRTHLATNDPHDPHARTLAVAPKQVPVTP